MDMLKVMLSHQKGLQQQLGYNFTTMTPEERAAYIKEYSFWVEDELHEMVHEIPFMKPWKKYSSDPELLEAARTKAIAEFADVLHFMLNIVLALGLSATDLYRIYLDKNAINYKRQEDTEAYKRCQE